MNTIIKERNFFLYARIKKNTSFEPVLVMGATLFKRNGYALISLVSANVLR